MRRRQIYRGRIIDVGLEHVTLPDGQELDLEIVRHPGGAAVVAIDDTGRVCLLRQYRHAADGWVWELPAGKIDPPEPASATARRELREETGLEGRYWQPLGTMLSSPGVFTEVIHLYLVHGLDAGQPDTEDHELIEIHWRPFEEALQWAAEGGIVDAKTIVGLFRAAQVLAAGVAQQDFVATESTKDTE